MALFIAGLTVAGITSAYLFSLTSTQRWSLSLAANARAMERIEETRSAQWDTRSWPTVDQLVAANFPDEIVILDQSGSGGGIIYATNITRFTEISASPPLKQIRVDCIWNFKGTQLVTNTIETCRAPNQ